MRNIVVSLFSLIAVAGAQDGKPAPRVTVYVSLDREHSEKVLSQFERETGIEVKAIYDTEANKTVGLVRKLIQEKSDPQADVYWNNELATTIKLKMSGVLAPYRSPSAASIPAAFKDAEGYWTGFAARARILIVNTDLVPKADRPTSMWDLTKPKWRGKTCMARPETGTTAAHAAALFVNDEPEARRYFDLLVKNDVTWVTGNSHVMREVSAGRFAFGWTDTDDFRVAQEQRQPVDAVFPDAGADDVGVMYIPNSLVLIKGAPHPAAGRALIDWLLRPEIEERLAHSATAQIPVRPGVKVPPHVRRPDQIGKVMPVNWERTGAEWDRWVETLRAKIASANPEAERKLAWIVAGLFLVMVMVGVALKRVTGDPN